MTDNKPTNCIITFFDKNIDNLFIMIEKAKHKLYKKRLVREGLTIGEQSYILAPSCIYNAQNIDIGRNVHINDHVLLNAVLTS